MDDRDHRGSTHPRQDIFHDNALCHIIKRRCRLVQHNDLGIAKPQSRQCQPLLFAARQQGSSFTDPRVQPAVQRGDQRQQLRPFKSCIQVCLRNRAVKYQVFPDRAVKHRRVLRRIRHFLVQGLQCDVPERLIVKINVALLVFQQADQKLCQCRFPGTGLPDECDLFAFLDRQADSVQHF